MEYGLTDMLIEVYVQHLCDDEQVSTKAETVVDLKDTVLLIIISEAKLL